MGIISGFLSMFCWGTADFFSAITSKRVGPLGTLFWGQVGGFSLALVYFLANFSSFSNFNLSGNLKYLLFLVPASFLHFVAFLYYYRGFAKGKVSLVSPISSTYVTIVVILSLIFFKEILAVHRIIAIVLIIFSVFLVSVNFRNLGEMKMHRPFTGVREGLIAMSFWGFSMFSLILLARALGWFIPIFGYRFLIILYSTIYLLFTRQSFKGIMPQTFPLLLLLFLIGFFDTTAFFNYSFGVMRGYASIIAPIAASYPLITVTSMRIFFKEKLAPNQIFGIAGIITGLILISV